MFDYVVFASDGSTLVAGSESCPASVWDVATGALLSFCKDDAGSFPRLAVSPDGRLLACARVDAKVNVWKIADGTLLHSFPFEGRERELAFSSDGSFLCLRGGYTMKIWDLRTGLSRCSFGKANLAVLGPIFSPDSKLLVTKLGHESDICLWDAQAGQRVGTLSGHTELIMEVVFSLDGQLLVSASSDGTVRLWEYNSNMGRNGLLPPPIRDMRIQLGGSLLAVSQRDDTATTTDVWEVATGAIQQTLNGHFCGAESANDMALLAVSEGKVLQIRDAHTGEHLFSAGAPSYLSTAALAIAVSPDGRILAIVFDLDVIPFDIASGSLRHELRRTGMAAAFSADSRLLAACTAEYVCLWDPLTGNVVHTLAGHAKRVTAVAFSPRGKTLASADQQTVRLWDCNTWRTARILTLLEPTTSLAFSADGRRLATDWGTLATPAKAAAARRLASARDRSDVEALTHLYIIGEWATWAGQWMLWLPPSFREARKRIAVHETTLALCNPDGTIGFAAFDLLRAAAAAAKPSSASDRAAASGRYQWGAPARKASVGQWFAAWSGFLVLSLALCWSASLPWTSTAIWTMSCGFSLLAFLLFTSISEARRHRAVEARHAEDREFWRGVRDSFVQKEQSYEAQQPKVCETIVED